MSEHSVEYLVVPHLKESLEREYKVVIPLYFWNTREGNTYSKNNQQLQEKLFKVLAVYPRRPKVANYHSETVFVKFNHQLFERANFNGKHGLGTIAGLPLITDIYEISTSPQIVYFRLLENGCEEILELPLIDEFSINSNSVVLVSPDQIRQVIEECKAMSWNKAVSLINESKYLSHYHTLFGGLYKPVYFFIKV